METPLASNPSTPVESEATMDCQLLLTTMTGNEVTLSTNIAQFDVFEDFDEHIDDYLATLGTIHSPPVGSKPFTSRSLVTIPNVKVFYVKAREAIHSTRPFFRQWAQSRPLRPFVRQ